MTTIEKLSAARKASVVKGMKTVTIDMDLYAEIAAKLLNVKLDAVATEELPDPTLTTLNPMGDPPVPVVADDGSGDGLVEGVYRFAQPADQTGGGAEIITPNHPTEDEDAPE